MSPLGKSAKIIYFPVKKEAVLRKNRHRAGKIVKWTVRVVFLILILTYLSEYLLRASNADTFFTLSAVPVSGNHSDLSDVLGDDEAYARATNYRGEEIFRNPTAAFEKTKKECAPTLKQIQKEKHLPDFSTITYRKYAYALGYAPYFPGGNWAQLNKVHFTCEFYLNSTQLLFFPKPPMDDSK
jgi:hypothetical protein